MSGWQLQKRPLRTCRKALEKDYRKGISLALAHPFGVQGMPRGISLVEVNPASRRAGNSRRTHALWVAMSGVQWPSLATRALEALHIGILSTLPSHRCSNPAHGSTVPAFLRPEAPGNPRSQALQERNGHSDLLSPDIRPFPAITRVPVEGKR